MALLASAGKTAKTEKEQGQGEVLGGSSKSITEYMAESDHPHQVTSNHDDEDVSQDLSAAELGKPTAEIDKITIGEDGINEIGEEEEKLNDFDYLIGNPLPNDILLYAVSVCGLYNALQTYKYRVKITPGTAKKGKAAKTAMNLFSHMPEVRIQEKDLMKACTDPELVTAIIGNVKITAPGLTQLKQKQKKKKKSAKDER